MINIPENVMLTGLQVFGKLSASISHEIKNALSIINENAGLLEDYIYMVDQGLPLNPEKLKNTSGTILKQVQRANDIVKNLNRLSHTADEPVKPVDLSEMFELIQSLTKRFTANRGLHLEVRPPTEPIIVATNPYCLLALLFLCLESLFKANGNGKNVQIFAEKKGTGTYIHVSRPDSAISDKTFPGEKERALGVLLNAEVIGDEKNKDIQIQLNG